MSGKKPENPVSKVSTGSNRSLRGGTWAKRYPILVPAAWRSSSTPSFRSNDYGFRLARTKK